jgi:hypothetical protein
MVSVNFSGQLPLWDMNQRFGPDLNVGADFYFKTNKKWVFGAEGNFFFGRNVKEKVTTQMMTSDGFVIDNSGFPADLRISERGWNSYLVVGRVFPKVFGYNPNSGLMINLGFGYMQHKIKLYDAQQQIAAVKGDLSKGYDRLTGGPALHQFIGYLFLSESRLINFVAGFEFYEAFTQSYRVYNYDTGKADTKQRLDGLVGFRIAWILPLYKKAPKEFYFN